MTPAEAAAFLRRYNEWRRTDDMYGMPYPDPREIGEAIDAAIEMIDRLEAAEKGRDALRAKIEQMERQEPVAWMCSDKAIIQMGYKKFSDRCEGCWNIPVFALPGAHPAPSVPDDIVREVLRDCCGTFHGSRHRITCEKYKGKRD